MTEKFKQKEEPKVCVLCLEDYVGYGHNAEPVMVGRCCNVCNFHFVIPARLATMRRHE